MKKLFSISTALAVIASAQAISVQTTDFIADGSRTYFNGFEGLPAVANAATPYTEDSIRLDQINGDVNGIWTTYSWGGEGSRSWYPNGGDNGYTRITLSDGSDFGDIGFLRGSGNGGHLTLVYELYENGALVFSGSVSHTVNAQYLGFSGGGFDEIRLRDTSSSTDTVSSGTHNALAIDSIEVRQVASTVPEGGSTLALMGFALTALSLAGRKFAARKNS